jgi:pSer/pThr/pTyr-binding forkhead associated (FHA) protein
LIINIIEGIAEIHNELVALIYIIESGQTARIVELRGTTTLGRDSDNDIVIDELAVSRCHAVLLVRPQGIVLIDLDSTNST